MDQDTVSVLAREAVRREDEMTGAAHPKQEWSFSPELVVMWDIAMTTSGPLEVILEHLHPDDRERVESELSRAVQARRPLAGQGRLRTRHGMRTFTFHGEVEHDDAGEPAAFAGYSIDVTAETSATMQTAVEGVLAHRSPIEQVKGALMFAGALGEQEAFEFLRHHSNASNVKVATLVTEIAAQLPLPALSEERDFASLVDLVERTAQSLAAEHDLSGRAPTA
jgi:hypothetical protein